MTYLELQGLARHYGEVVAVAECTLSIAQGEFVCLLGPSGCGKTTTLQMVAGFVVPTRGRVVLQGQDLTPLKPYQRGLGVVFQNYALFPHMTVEENVGFGLEMRQVSSAQRRARVGEALDLVRLAEKGRRYPRELSCGQRQRVALARALVIRPPVLLLDEPMGALDAKLREEMQVELRALQRRLGITTLMVTHDQAEAMTLADRVVLMNQGRIEQQGAPHELYERPQGAFASTFLGRANIVRGRLGERAVLAGAVSLPCAWQTEVPAGAGAVTACGMPGDDVEALLRPEKILFCGLDRACLRGRILARAFVGHHWLFQVETSLGVWEVLQVNRGLPDAAEGDEVGLAWDAADLKVLPR